MKKLIALALTLALTISAIANALHYTVYNGPTAPAQHTVIILGNDMTEVDSAANIVREDINGHEEQLALKIANLTPECLAMITFANLRNLGFTFEEALDIIEKAAFYEANRRVKKLEQGL